MTRRTYRSDVETITSGHCSVINRIGSSQRCFGECKSSACVCSRATSIWRAQSMGTASRAWRRAAGVLWFTASAAGATTTESRHAVRTAVRNTRHGSECCSLRWGATWATNGIWKPRSVWESIWCTTSRYGYGRTTTRIWTATKNARRWKGRRWRRNQLWWIVKSSKEYRGNRCFGSIYFCCRRAGSCRPSWIPRGASTGAVWSAAASNWTTGSFWWPSWPSDADGRTTRATEHEYEYEYALSGPARRR